MPMSFVFVRPMWTMRRSCPGGGGGRQVDFVARGFVAEGKLKALVEDDGLRGVTSNPAIFEIHADVLRLRPANVDHAPLLSRGRRRPAGIRRPEGGACG
jgi:hypothetical protein